MPFAFSYVCDLLQRLDDNQRARTGQKLNASIIRAWFAGHRALLGRDDVDQSALLSALLPEKRTDRVYCIQSRSLQGIIGRALLLGLTRIDQLARWELPGSGQDLADCVEGILRETPNPSCGEDVTVEEIDGTLHAIAAGVRFSSPAVRSSRPSTKTPKADALGQLYRRLYARDAKWLTRLVLKNYQPVKLEEWIVYSCCHPLLPDVLRVQDDFMVALRMLREHRQASGVVNGLLRRADIASQLRPALGVKIGRQPWLKARSIKHCLDMAHGRMGCERKYDGEYCQIHVDLSNGYNCIQIFSKSGKDSTFDRAALHGVIRSSLGIGTPSCKIKEACILEGELLVYSEKDKKILGFEKIRKHVSRSGRFIGTGIDSQPHDYEHLMIVYFDLLLVDDESLLGTKHSERFRRLSDLVECEPGRAQLAERQVIDFTSRRAASLLREAFASCIVRGEEGLVLKPDDPYFDFGEGRRRFSCSAIKLKKGYIGKFGDVGDFAVVAARYDASKAKDHHGLRVKWTHFFVACLANKDDVRRWGDRPVFQAVNVVELNETLMKTLILQVHPEPIPYTGDEDGRFVVRIQPGVAQGKPPTHKFNNPFVVDLRCFSFHREGNTNLWSLRFPYVTKIHFDRTCKDVLGFQELQEMAEAERKTPELEDSQEMARWIQALKQADGKGAARDSQQTTSTESTSAAITPSPARSTQRSRRTATSLSPISEHPVAAATRGYCPNPTSARGGALSASHPPLLDEGAVESDIVAAGPPESPTRVCRKRPAEQGDMTPRRSPRKKQARSPLPQTASRAETQSFSQREPLRDITASSSSQGCATPAPASQSLAPGSFTISRENEQPDGAGRAPDVPSSPLVSLRAAPAEGPSSPAPDRTGIPQSSGATTIPSSPPPAVPTTKWLAPCRYAGNVCALAGLRILLSPCVASIPWVTQDLISYHGVASVFVTISSWENSSSVLGSDGAPPSSLPGPAAAPDPEPRRGARRPRMIALVESRRREATAAFLRDIESARLARRNGQRRWVEVFDWRVLEAVTDEEGKLYREEDGATRQQAGTGAHRHGLWRKWRVGLA